MKYRTLACAGLVALVACATDGTGEDPVPPTHTKTDQGDDAGAPIADAGTGDADAPDAERPLVCSDTSVCETRIPTSDLGEPLSLRGVWVVSSNDVWTVSAQGLILHYDGTSWTTSHRANHALYSVWATASDVWAGGEQGLLLHRSADGAWKRVEASHVQPIRAIYGTSPSDVWFTGRTGAVDHFDGLKLTTFSTDVPGLRMTTIFGCPGFGTYAAGYVERPLNPNTGMVDHEPYIFELASTKISTFNASLTSQLGFVPVSGVTTDAPDDDHRVFLFGYQDWYSTLTSSYSAFGKDTPVVVARTGEPSTSDPKGKPPPPPTFPVWANAWNDIRLINGVGRVVRWNGTDFTRQEFDMGYSFVPRTVFGAHGNTVDMWIVGDGFALKGATP
jgi:hypothetical protein